MPIVSGIIGDMRNWLLIALLLSLVAFAKDFTPPPAKNAATYPLHETHANEHLTIAVEPFSESQMADAKVKYHQHDLTPLRLIITNDGDSPVPLIDLRVELITGARDKVPPATEDDIARRIGRHDKNPDRTTRVSPFPRIPGVGSTKKPRVSADKENEIENLMFHAKAVEPHSTQAGFLFFDTQGLSDPLHNARLYITGLTDSHGNQIMYFEIPLQ